MAKWYAMTLMGVGLTAFPAPALAGPTVDVAAPSPTPSARVGAFYTEPGAIKGARGANVVFHAGDRAGHSYCNTYGPGTRIVGAKYLARRWHTQHITGRLRILGETGQAWSATNNDLVHGVTFNEWAPARSAGCVAIEWHQTGRTSGGPGWNPVFTAQLTHLRIEDLHGPRVSAVQGPTGWITGRSATVSWTSDDNRLLRGATGVSIAGREVSRGDAPNGPIDANLDLSHLEDGDGHVATVWRRGSFWPTATARLRLKIDRTPPGAPTPGPLAGWSRNPELRVGPTQDALSGFREIQVRVGGGGWERLASRPAFPDGVHRVALRALDVAGNVSAPVERTFHVDTTAPSARLAARSSGPGTAELDVGGTGDATSGVARWTVRLGGPDGTVVARSSDPRALRHARAANGTHRFHLHVEDRAGNVAEAWSPPVRFDDRAPSVQISRLPSGWIDGFRVVRTRDNRLGVDLAHGVGDRGIGPVQVQLRQRAGWRVVARYNEPGSPRLGVGSHRLTIDLDVPGVASGPAEVRVVAMDADHVALRGVTRSRRVLLDLDGVDYRALGIPDAGLAGARFDPASGVHVWDVTSPGGVRFPLWDLEALAPPRLRVAGARRTLRFRGRRIPLKRTVTGRVVRVAGRVSGPNGGLGGVVVLLRDPQRRTVARTTTGPRGGFVLSGRASRGGVWSTEAIGRGRLVSRFALRVRPRLRLSASRREVPAGGRVVLRGSVLPRRGSYAKTVQLQFRDGHRWRPFANARINSLGRYRLAYRFRRAGGYRVHIRAVMLRQADWPFTPGVARPIVVSVRP